MAAYLGLDIEAGPCLDQQVHAAVVAIGCGPDERRAAILRHEWTWGATEVRSITVREEGRSGMGLSVRGGSAVSRWVDPACPLMAAASKGSDGLVNLLVKAGAKLDVQSNVGGHEWTCRIHPPTHCAATPHTHTPVPLRPPPTR